MNYYNSREHDNNRVIKGEGVKIIVFHFVAMKMKYTPRQCDLHRVQHKVFVRLFDTNILVLCSFLCFILQVTTINNDCKNHDETILKIVLLLDSKLKIYGRGNYLIPQFTIGLSLNI